MTLAIVSLAARGDEEIAVTFEIRSGEHTQTQRFTVSAATVADLHLHTGVCDTDCYDAVSRASEVCSAIKKALYLLGYGRCSESALCRKLVSKGIDREIAAEAVEELCRRGYLDAENDALREAERCVAKHWGRKRIAAALFEKGYRQSTIQSALNRLEDDGVDFVEVCAERLRRTEIPDDPDACRKLIASLERNGFSRSEIRDAMQCVLDETED